MIDYFGCYRKGDIQSSLLLPGAIRPETAGLSMPAAWLQMVRECRISDASSNTDQMQAQAAGRWIMPGTT
jgi:hypothetical protein